MATKRCKTVGELLAALAEWDPNAPIIASGPDIGGYDWTWCQGVEVGATDDYYCKGHPEAAKLPTNACMLYSCEEG